MKPKLFFIIKYIVITWAAAFALSCTKDATIPDVSGNDKPVTIRFALSGAGDSPRTYGMPAEENAINTIDVLSFVVDPVYPNDMSKGSFFYRAVTTYVPGQNSFNAVLYEYPQNQTLVILVNSRAVLQSANLALGESKASVMAKLVEAQSTAFDPAAMTQIPMWGHIPNQSINAFYTTPGIVQLVRMLARINIVNNEADFNLQTAYLYNPREKGAYMPDNWDGTNNTVLTPTQPAGAVMPVGSYFMYNTAINGFSDKIYTFEADNRVESAVSRLNSTCVIVGGDYTDGTGTYPCFYRIDLKIPGTETYYNILRNHSYNITIDQISEPGTDTPEEAYQGLTYIKATVEDWTDMGSSVNVDGPNHLYVSQNLVFFDLGAQGSANTENKITIESTDGWQITDYPSWAVPGQLAGVAGTPATVSLNAESSSVNRQGSMKIVSGNLTYNVNILQAACGMNGFPLRQKIGNNMYRTYQYGTACWMVENSREGVSSAQMFNNDPGKTNGYYYTYVQAFNPVNGPCPAGWSLPSAAQWTLLQNATLADPTVAGKWWLGTTGLLNGGYAGYYQNDYNWIEWGESGVWWIQGATRPYVVSYYGSQSYINFPTGEADYLFSVRCIKN